MLSQVPSGARNHLLLLSEMLWALLLLWVMLSEHQSWVLLEQPSGMSHM
jgi:hypothetical protein